MFSLKLKKIAKRPNDFISCKQFQKRPNGNYALTTIFSFIWQKNEWSSFMLCRYLLLISSNQLQKKFRKLVRTKFSEELLW